MLWMLVNRFAILEIKEYNPKNSKLLEISVCPSLLVPTATDRQFWWKKKLSLKPMINIFNIYETFLHFPITLKTTDTFKTFSIWALVDSRAMGIFFSQNFIKKYYINTYRLSKPVPVYNVDRISSKDR